MNTFLNVTTVDGKPGLDTRTVFLADSDQEAITAGRECRRAIADAYCRGFDHGVRVQVFSLELGRWDSEQGDFTTSCGRQLLDSWQDDRQAARCRPAPAPLRLVGDAVYSREHTAAIVRGLGR